MKTPDLMEKIVRIKINTSGTFGREEYVPVSELAKIFCNIKRRKVLSLDDIISLHNQGFAFEFTGDRSEVLSRVFPDMFKGEQK